MSDSVSFLISLQERISGPAASAQSALGSLEAQIRQEESALKRLEQWQKRVTSAQNVDGAEASKVAGLIAQKRSSLAGLTEQLAAMGPAGLEAGQQGAMGLDALMTAAKAGMGPMGGLFEKASLLKNAIGAGGLAAAAVAAAAAVVVLIAALVAGFVALAQFAFASADAARSQRLLAEAATGSAAGARALGGVVDGLAGKVATSRAQLDELALSRSRAGLAGKALESAAGAIATATAVAGQAAGQKLQSIAEKAQQAGKFILKAVDLHGSGVTIDQVAAALAAKLGTTLAGARAAIDAGTVSVADGLDALNKAVDSKFGALAKKQLLALPAQLGRLRENFAKLFADVNIEPFLSGLADLLAMFDQSTAAGRALKMIGTEVFDALFAAAARVLPYIKAFMQGLVIAGLQIYIAIKPVARAISEAFGGTALSSIFSVKNALTAAKGIVYVLVAVFGVIGAVMGASMTIIGFAIRNVLTLIGGIVDAVSWVIDAFSSVGEAGSIAWNSITSGLSGALAAVTGFVGGFLEAGANIIAGLVEGITSGAGAILSALLAPVKNGIAAVKAALGIASPSRVFAQLGEHTAAGFAEGVDAGAGDVAGSVASMVGTPSAEASKPGARGAAAGLTIETINIDARGASDPEMVKAMTLAGMLEALERMGLQMGTA